MRIGRDAESLIGFQINAIPLGLARMLCYEQRSLFNQQGHQCSIVTPNPRQYWDVVLHKNLHRKLVLITRMIDTTRAQQVTFGGICTGVDKDLFASRVVVDICGNIVHLTYLVSARKEYLKMN